MDYTAAGSPSRVIADSLRHLVILESHKECEKREELIQKALGDLAEVKIMTPNDALQVVKLLAMDLIQHRAIYKKDSKTSEAVERVFSEVNEVVTAALAEGQ